MKLRFRPRFERFKTTRISFLSGLTIVGVTVDQAGAVFTFPPHVAAVAFQILVSASFHTVRSYRRAI